MPKDIDLTKTSTQSSPDCYARVIRYVRRDTQDYSRSDRKPNVKIVSEDLKESIKGIRHDLSKRGKIDLVTGSSSFDIASDIIACSINKTKSSPTGRFSMILSSGDINYHHVLHPGDHIFIWMRRNRPNPMVKKSDRIFNNKEDSGLKFYGIITDVRRRFQTMPNGQKVLRYHVIGKDFGYFLEADVFYNASLASIFKNSPLAFQTVTFRPSALGITADPRTTGGFLYHPDLIAKAFIKTYLGSGPKKTIEDNRKSEEEGRPITENTLLFLPNGVSTTFGVKPQKNNVFANLLSIQAGIQDYSNNPKPKLSKMKGFKLFHIDPGSNYTLWSILQAYGNLAVNEMFTDLKRDGNGRLLPTFTLRQIPFTTKKAQRTFSNSHLKLKSTAFIDLPRLKIPEKFIKEENIGRGDHERFNFISLIGSTPGLNDYINIAVQTDLGNYAVDSASVKRYGLRTLIAKTDWHFPDSNKELRMSLVPVWINLLADWWLGAHRFESGSLELIGIEEPLSVGDNIEIVREDGINELYHIESYTHNYGVEKESGKKTFRTTVNLTRGQRVDELPVYASGQINEEDILNIGLTDTEFEGTAREGNSNNEDISAIDEFERATIRKKKNSTGGNDGFGGLF